MRRMGGGGIDVAHDEGDGRFDADGGSGDGVVTGLGGLADAFEAKDAEVSPAGGEVGIGEFADACERHGLIIRFGLHRHWIRVGGVGCRAGCLDRMPEKDITLFEAWD